ncbi:TonB-dependent receptor SusC [bioreactor metagenome]|uniref:TonB-dependent receptor SusC n=1 Tax=bioreactor metagenome TaxID=1076179 RepID=A0A644WRR0_9ZZZZ
MNIKCYRALIFGIGLMITNSLAVNAQKVTFNGEQISLKQAFEKIESASKYKIAYNATQLDVSKPVSINQKDEDVLKVLDILLKESGYTYKVSNGYIVIVPLKKDAVKKIRGNVKDSSGQPVIGATVMMKGTTTGTVTDMDGNFAIEVEEGSTLEFSYIGYQNQQIKATAGKMLSIVLSENTEMLDEVVVVGYGTMKKSDLTGSVINIKSEKLLSKPVVNVGQALSGKAAGVEIYENGGTPDGKVRIRIRGNNSINSSNDPLYVVDGIVGVSNINMLNPSEIESLEVLKDASATAIYGARGANGVIMITTKRGLKSQVPQITYDGYVSLGTMAKKIGLMNAEEWWSNYNITMDNGVKYDPKGYASGKYKKVNPSDLPNLFDSNGKPIYDTDWQEEAYGGTAVSHNHQLSIRGGAENTQYSVHLGYMNKDALMKNCFLERYTGRINIDSQLRSWLKFGANMSFNYNKGNDNYRNYGIKRLVQEAIPLIPVKYQSGDWGSNRDFPGAVQDTPVRYLDEIINQTTNIQSTGDLYLDLKITKDLSFKSTFAVDMYNRKRNFYSGKELIQFSKNNGGIATIETQKSIYWQNENYLNWNKEFNPNSRLNLMAGFSWSKIAVESLGATAEKFSDDFYSWHNLGAGTVTKPSSSSDNTSSLNSYFARLNYSHMNRYLFTATGRYDGSSKFGSNNRYAFFPSFAFAWRLKEENFLKDIDLINNLKLRTSIGETGNQEIGAYAFTQNLGSSNIILGNEYYTSLYRSTFGNPDLKWERTLQWDAGIDLGLLNQRVDLSLDYYYKETNDLLLDAPIPSSSGLSTIMRNIGSVENKGFELTLNTHNIKTQDFNWTSTILFNINKNEVTKLGENDEDIFPEPRHTQGSMLILRVGEPVGSLWGYNRIGTWSESEVSEAAKYGRLPGDLKYEDVNNDGRINSDDQQIIGCTSPDFTMTFSNTFAYKNFDFSFDLRFVFGNKVVLASTHNSEDRAGVANGFTSNLSAWTPTNQNSLIAQRRPMKSYYDSYPDSHWMQNGSFVRGQNFVLGYTFGKSLLNKLKIQNLRVYASAQNLFCITSYAGYDPEVTTYESAAFGQGIDDFAEPKARTFTFGLNLNF